MLKLLGPIQGYFYAAPTPILNNAEFNDKLKNLVFSYVDESSLLDNVYSVDGYKVKNDFKYFKFIFYRMGIVF